MKLNSIINKLFIVVVALGTVAISNPLLCQEVTFEERLKRASEEGKAGAEKAAESVSQKVAEQSTSVSQRVAEQSAIIAERVRVTVDNMRRAFEGQPLKPIYNDAYYKAVFNAKEDGSVQDIAPLIAIAPWNNELIWRDAEKTQVLMVSWMPKWAVDRFYRPELGKAFQTTTLNDLSGQPIYIWATVVPQVKKFTQEYKKNPIAGITLAQRLKQYLGLPDSKDEYFFVEFWVRPQDIFRPCINTDIIGNVCLPDYNLQILPASYKDIFNYVPHDQNYKKWFTERRKTAYVGDAPFPWTRIGYTYDWASKEPRKVGASEFVIKQGVTIYIHSITPTDDYPQLPLSKGNQ